LAEQKKITLAEITLQEYQTLSEHFAQDVFDVFNFETSVERKDVKGGTSKRAVLEQIDLVLNQVNTA
jgi:argininosuccinate lyase